MAEYASSIAQIRLVRIFSQGTLPNLRVVIYQLDETSFAMNLVEQTMAVAQSLQGPSTSNCYELATSRWHMTE